MLHPTKLNGETWYIPDNIHLTLGDNRHYDNGRVQISGAISDFSPIVEVSKGVFRFDDPKTFRMYIFTSSGYDASRIEDDRRENILSGYMQDIKDFRNVECTVVLEYKRGATITQEVLLECRGAKRIGSKPCQVTRYGGGVRWENVSIGQWVKILNNNNIIQEDWNQTKLSGSMRNQKFMLKFICYDIDINGNPTVDPSKAVFVKMQVWGSFDDTNNFEQMLLLKERIDNGGWGSGGGCNGDPDQILLYGAPLVEFSWDSGAEFNFSKLSVREINPTVFFPPQDPPTEPPSGGGGGTGTDANDYLGIRKIYKTKLGGSYFNPPLEGLLNDDRFDKGSGGTDVTHKGNGIYHVDGGTIRIKFYSTKLARDRSDSHDFPTYNFNELKQRGFWDAPTDFINYEYTIYLKHLRAKSDGDEFSLVGQSVNHDGDHHGGCGGVSNHGNIGIFNGKPRFKKEQFHVDYETDSFGDRGIGRITDRLIGMKFIKYNLNDGVQLEIWFDQNADNNWELYLEKFDNNNWGDNMKKCGALRDGESITWGSPEMILKCNDQEFEFSKVSVREITGERLIVSDTDTGGGSGGGGGGSSGGGSGGGTGGGQLTRVRSRYIFIWDNIIDRSGFICSGGGVPSNPSYSLFGYDIDIITHPKELSADFPAESDRLRAVAYVNKTDSILFGEKITKCEFYIRKEGLPTGTLYFEAYDNNTPTPNVKVLYGTLDVSTLTSSYVLYSRTNDNAGNSMPNGLELGWAIGVRFESTFSDDTNHIDVGVNYNDPIDSDKTILAQWELETGGYAYDKYTGRDLCGKLYRSP